MTQPTYRSDASFEAEAASLRADLERHPFTGETLTPSVEHIRALHNWTAFWDKRKEIERRERAAQTERSDR